MALPVLSLHGIGKSYRNYVSSMRRFLGWFGLSAGGFKEHWILRGITFDILRGEAVGIAGRNGAGKSTLLKMIAGTLAATEGDYVVRGRISAILELGMGFHPEFSGRQNAMHACGLMGRERAEILAIMPEIEEFAEIGEYFDQPVRTYSSGMQVRLAFSVATAFRPEILIVDEALSVGDAYFQHKSFARIREFQKQGTTLLLVSHDRGAILSLCDRVFLLEQGRIVKDGVPEMVMDFYNALIAERENGTIEQALLEDGNARTISGTNEALVEELGLYNAEGKKVDIVGVGELVELRVRVKVQADIPELVVGYMIKGRLGQEIYGTNTYFLDSPLEQVSQGSMATFRFWFPATLGSGSYSVTVALHAGESHVVRNYCWIDYALIFEVVNIDKDVFSGLAWLPPKLEIVIA